MPAPALPGPAGGKGGVDLRTQIARLREQQALARGFGTGSVLSVPFMLDERRQGVMVFEWPAAQAPSGAHSTTMPRATVMRGFT